MKNKKDTIRSLFNSVFYAESSLSKILPVTPLGPNSNLCVFCGTQKCKPAGGTYECVEEFHDLDLDDRWLYNICGSPYCQNEHCQYAQSLWKDAYSTTYIVNALQRKFKNKTNQNNPGKGDSNMSSRLFTPGLTVTKTQKARGIQYLREIRNDFYLYDASIEVPEHFFFKASHKWEEDNGQWKFPLFGRPCPMVPCHGFVDSKKIHDILELREMFTDTFYEDETAEVALTSPINCDASGIFSGNMLTIGAGNDGATSATGDCLQFPVVRNKIKRPPQHIVAQDEGDFWEYLVKGNNLYLVQVRSGPIMEGLSEDFIPKDLVVEEVVVPTGDLLEWAEEVSDFDPGTVVFGPAGSLSSHYGVHCVLNDVPYITTREPLVGEDLQKNVDIESFEPDVEGLCKGFKRGVSYSPKSGDWYDWGTKVADSALCVLHNLPAILTSPIKLYNIGTILGALFRVSVAICVGESRHEKNCYRRGDGRTDLYHRTAESCYYTHVKELEKVWASFNYGRYDRGYGGANWADCATAIIELHNQFQAEDLQGIFGALNTLINACHNNGRLLNKLVNGKSFDYANSHCDLFAMSRSAAIFSVVTTIKEANIQPAELQDIAFDHDVAHRKYKVIKNYSRILSDIGDCAATNEERIAILVEEVERFKPYSDHHNILCEKLDAKLEEHRRVTKKLEEFETVVENLTKAFSENTAASFLNYHKSLPKDTPHSTDCEGCDICQNEKWQALVEFDRFSMDLENVWKYGGLSALRLGRQFEKIFNDKCSSFYEARCALDWSGHPTIQTRLIGENLWSNSSVYLDDKHPATAVLKAALSIEDVESVPIEIDNKGQLIYRGQELLDEGFRLKGVNWQNLDLIKYINLYLQSPSVHNISIYSTSTRDALG